jgi:hypothetical protein
MSAELREHRVAPDQLLECCSCARPLRPGAVYLAEWVVVPAPVPEADEGGSLDYVSDGDAPVYCRGCAAARAILDRVPEDDDGPPSPPRPRTRQHTAPPAPPRPPVPPRRRRRFPRWPIVLAVVVVFAWIGLRSLAGPANQGCPAGTTYEDTSLVVICNAPSGRTVCQLQPGYIDGSWTWPRCS